MAMKPKASRSRKGIAQPRSGDSDVSAKLRSFWKTYERHCAETGSCTCPLLRQDVLQCIKNEKILTKITMAFPKHSPELEVPSSLRPLFLAMRDERYTCCLELCIWDLYLRRHIITDLCQLLEKRDLTEYQFRHLELLDCRLDAWSLERLGRAVTLNSLTSLCLDYTAIGEDGLKGLLFGLNRNNHVFSLSLCYCGLGPGSGAQLANLVTTSALSDLYVDGNDLQCGGAIELVRELALYAEQAHLQKHSPSPQNHPLLLTAEPNSQESTTVTARRKKTKTKKVPGKRSKKRRSLAEIGPWLDKLHLSDNAIDTSGSERIMGTLNFMHTISPLIKFSDHLTELDLSENHIGDLSGALLLEALRVRRDAKLTPLKVKVTTRMNAETFAAILKLTKELKPMKKNKRV